MGTFSIYDQLVANVSCQNANKSDITSVKHCLVPGANLRANRKGKIVMKNCRPVLNFQPYYCP